MGKRDDALVPVALFDDRTVAEEAWARLTEAGIASSVVTDPAPFGGAVTVAVQVARRDADRAQRLIADLV
ncbi:MAG: hypothetical protein ACE5GC_10530 [Acidimicrobiia bacterium]